VRSFAALGFLLLLLSMAAAPASASVLVVGDSLVVGTAPYLRAQLSESVQSDGRIGRPSPEAVSVLRSRFSGQRVVVFDAGVNDDPSRPGTLSRDLATVRGLVGGRCLVVSTMSRPPYRGVSVDGLNQAVRSFAGSSSNVRLVDWRSAALSHPRLINSDGVHPTAAGYRLRAGLFASAIGQCGSGGSSGGAPPSGGLPAPGTPPPADDLNPGTGPPSPPRRKRRPPPKPKPPPPKPKLGSESPVLIDEPVSFTGAGGVRLSGELLAPAGGGRHPAVVMIGGSGAATREPYREQAEFLAEHGVAALIYDKRGAGDSGGSSDYRYSDLAGDARAAVEMLHTRSEVRPESVGVWGFGEGASIAPMVAAGYPDVAAVMVVSPSALAPASQQEWAVRRALSVGGADAGVDAVSRYYAVASDASSPDLRADPSGAWRSVSQPVLAVWGSADRLVPIHDSAVALQGALTSADALEADRLFRTFEGASHSLGIASQGGRAGSAPGFKELSASWLRSHVRPPSRGPRAISSALGYMPVPPASGPPVVAVQEVSLLERWPVQVAWLILPALVLLLVAARAWRRRKRVDGDETAGPRWWWLAGVAALDLLAVGALAVAVAAIVADGGEGVSAVAGVPTVILVAWAVTLAGVVATALLARRARSLRSPAAGVVLAGSAWLLLALFWLV
jgi:alpha-beta hydrolase superfamily lysophospholipase